MGVIVGGGLLRGSRRRAETRKLVDLLQKRHINILGTLVTDVPAHYMEHTIPAPQQAVAGGTDHKENRHVYSDALQNV